MFIPTLERSHYATWNSILLILIVNARGPSKLGRESISVKQQNCGLGFMIFVLTSLVSLSKKKICIKIVELENCYKGKKFTQSFLPLDMEVQEGLGRRMGEGEAREGRRECCDSWGCCQGDLSSWAVRGLPLPQHYKQLFPPNVRASWLNFTSDLAHLSNLHEGCLPISPDCFY